MQARMDRMAEATIRALNLAGQERTAREAATKTPTPPKQAA